MKSISSDQLYEEEEEEIKSVQQNFEQTQPESLKSSIHTLNKMNSFNHPDVFTPIQKQFFYNQCQNIINQIMKFDNAYFFYKPVDPEKDVAPGYYEFIAQPMSIFDVQQRIDNDQYHTPDEFINDMRLIWLNAKLYNAPSHLVYKAAEDLSFKFEMMAATLPHVVDEASLNSGFQREVELRFSRYKLMKKTHL